MPGASTRGTEIVLHLKKDAEKYLETYEIERIVGAYSDNIQFPIELKPEEGEPRQINSASALWQRPKSELTPEDYTQAYKSIAGAFDEPAMTLHYRAEGRQSYAVLLFAPSTKPFDLFEPNPQGPGQALCPPRLHRRRCRPVAGLSPLHPRRDRQRGSAAQYLARDAAEQSAARANPQSGDRPGDRRAGKPRARRSRRTFAKIWDAFGPVIKEGIWEDFERREKLLALSRFTTTSGEKRSLKQYAENLKPNQTEIYYLVGDSIERLKSNPKLESADRPRHRGAAADRSGRRVLDLGAARFRRQAAEVAEPGRRRFRLDPAARRQRRRTRTSPAPTRLRPSP